MSRTRETVWVLAMNAVQIAASALAFIRLARVLGPADYGTFSLAIAIASFLPLLAGLGADHVLVMKGSRSESQLDQLFGNALLLRSAASAVIFTVLCLVVARTQSTSPAVLVLVPSAALLIAFGQPLMASYYRVIGRPRFVWAAIAAGQVLFCALLYCPLIPVSLNGASWAYLASAATVVLVLAFDMHRRSRRVWDASLMRDNMRLGIFFASSQLVDLAFQRVDVIVLQLLLGAAAVGTYTAGFKFVSILLVIPSALNVVHLPAFHRAAGDASGSHESLDEVFLAMRSVLLELSALLLGGMAVVADRIVSVFLGSEYAGASRVIVVGCVAMYFTFAAYPYYMLAEAMGRVRRRFWMRVLVTAITAIVVTLLTRTLGVVGAAGGLAVGSALWLGMLHGITRTMNGGLRALVVDAMPLIASFVAVLLVRNLQAHVASGASGLLAVGSAYVVIFLCVGSGIGVLKTCNVLRFARSAPGKS